MTLLLILAGAYVANATFMLLVSLVAHRQTHLALATGVLAGVTFAGTMTWTVDAHSFAATLAYGLAYGLAVWTALWLDPRLERRFGERTHGVRTEKGVGE